MVLCRCAPDGQSTNKNERYKMNELQQILTAIKALTDRVDAFETKLSPLFVMAEQAAKIQAQQKVVQQAMQEMDVIAKAIPDETKKALGVVGCNIDPGKHWFRLIRDNGTAISIKKLENSFRVRVRGTDGELVKEATPNLNGLNAALAEIAGV